MGTLELGSGRCPAQGAARGRHARTAPCVESLSWWHPERGSCKGMEGDRGQAGDGSSA